jgi:ferredoxin
MAERSAPSWPAESVGARYATLFSRNRPDYWSPRGRRSTGIWQWWHLHLLSGGVAMCTGAGRLEGMVRNMASRWLLDVDHGVCIRSGMCVGSAPDAFELTSTRQSRPKATAVDADDVILEAAENCPMEAITITDAATGSTIFPSAD